MEGGKRERERQKKEKEENIKQSVTRISDGILCTGDARSLCSGYVYLGICMYT